MRACIVMATFCALVGAAVFAKQSLAQQGENVRMATASPSREKMPKFTFILFWKENSAATQAAAAKLKAAVEKRPDRAGWTSVDVGDRAQRAVVERYQVSRAPMPLVLCVAPNGAVTGAMMQQVSEEAVEKALVTPAMADATKALQEQKIVVIHVKQDEKSPLPAAALVLMADPLFKDRIAAVNVVFDDPAEKRFVTDMEIKPSDVRGSMLVVLAPPGALVGKFPATASKEQIAAAIHAAGKCCDDPNCKLNQKGQ